jgi:IS30 family transposase
MRYHQLTSEERYALAHMRQSHYSQAEIARVLGRHPSTISRELRRNRREDGFYRAFTAEEKTRARRSRSRRNPRTAPAWAALKAVPSSGPSTVTAPSPSSAAKLATQ